MRVGGWIVLFSGRACPALRRHFDRRRRQRDWGLEAEQEGIATTRRSENAKAMAQACTDRGSPHLTCAAGTIDWHLSKIGTSTSGDTAPSPQAPDVRNGCDLSHSFFTGLFSPMNQTAIQMFSSLGVGVLCIVLGVMALAVFFTLLGRIANAGAKPETMSVRGVLKKDTWAKVYMSGDETFDRVRFVGFTNTENIKNHLPYELNGMVILEDERKCRYLVRAKAIRMIVVEPEGEERGGAG
jgi:hypothetical protein